MYAGSSTITEVAHITTLHISQNESTNRTYQHSVHKVQNPALSVIVVMEGKHRDELALC